MKMLVSAILMASLISPESVAASDEIERLTGKDGGRSPAFTVNGPWIMEWSARSEFPLLASFEMRLYDAEADEFVGTVADLKGTGSGLKLFEKVGTFRLVIIATHSEWDIRIKEVSNEEAAVIKRRAEGEPTILDTAHRAVSRVPEGSFESWRPDGNDTLLLFSDAGLRWRVLFSSACPGLESATAISFVMAARDGNVDQYDSILLDDGTRCYFDKAIPSVVQR